jgi:autotransporter-associated beta strand protein
MPTQSPVKTTLALFSTIFLLAAEARAGSATWNLNPTTGNWNTVTNWTPATVPNSTADTATFGVSNVTGITLTATTTVASMVFKPGASAYTFNELTAPSDLMLTGAGIVNNSGALQTFNITQATLRFQNSATAGNLTAIAGPVVFSNSASAGTAAFTSLAGIGIVFLDTATAAQANLFVTAGTNTVAARLFFEGNSTAGSATITAQGGSTSAALGGFVLFEDFATAGNATLTMEGATAAGPNGHSVLSFGSASNAGSAVLIATAGTNGGNGGSLQFTDTSTGSGARAEMFGNGNLDISVHHMGGVSIGSVEGDGVIFLGKWPLTVSGTLSTTFSGVIQDGGFFGGTRGSLVQAGTGTLTLGGANTYTGGTTVSAGTLVASNTTGSATGTGAVALNGGTLGGSGTISGAVAVNSGGFLAPAAGTKKQATLTVGSALTFNSGSTYTYTFKAKGNKARTDKVVSNGVTIASGATFSFSGQAQGQLRAGTVFTVLSNTSASPISGTFSNLPDGAILTVNGNDLQATYAGGDGNDLTLTVVP